MRISDWSSDVCSSDLDLLQQQGVATAEQVEAAKKMPLGVTKRGSLADSSFPGFMDLVKRQLREDYRDEDLTEEGLRIFTSFDPILQMKAEASVNDTFRSEEHTSELQSLMRISYAVFCLKKKNYKLHQ